VRCAVQHINEDIYHLAIRRRLIAWHGIVIKAENDWRGIRWSQVVIQSQLPRFLFFYQYTALSSRAVDFHQMYFGDTVVGNTSTIGIEISPTPPLIFTGVKKCEICRCFQHHSN